MSETNADNGNGQDAGSEPQFDIQKVYTKDISLETPNTPSAFREEWQPDINIQLNTEAEQIGEGFFEVTLMVTATAKLGENTAFLVEVHQAGIFAISNMPEDEMGPVLGSLCPGILFPYAREVVSDLVTRSGFPPLVLSPVNFDALYYQAVMEQQNGEQA
jgi:preprotein translocase subunit SecB